MNQQTLHVTHTRTVVRALSWRVVATTTTIIATYFVTGEWILALEVGAIEATAKLILYYAHDRVWLAVPWGIKEKA